MIQVLFGFFLLATAISANKVLLVAVPPLWLVGVRMLFAGIILLALSWWRDGTWRCNKRDLLSLSIIALLTTFIPSFCKAYALKYLPSSKAAFIGSLDPFVTALYAWLLWSEVLSWRKVLGIALGFIGSLVICCEGRVFNYHTMYDFLCFALPEIMAFIAVLVSRYGWIMVQQHLKRDRYTPVHLNGLIMFLSGLIALPLSWITEQSFLMVACLPASKVGYLLYTIIVGNVIAYTMYAYFLKKYSASFVSLAGFSVPLFVTGLGMLLLGESLSWSLAVGAVFILVGVSVFYRAEIEKLL